MSLLQQEVPAQVPHLKVQNLEILHDLKTKKRHPKQKASTINNTMTSKKFLTQNSYQHGQANGDVRHGSNKHNDLGLAN
jgi:hypothetical protein